MTKTLEAVFDGEVFRPDIRPDLEPNHRYSITIEPIESERKGTHDFCDVLERLAGTVEMPEDWSEEHDHYLYGTPKRSGRIET